MISLVIFSVCTLLLLIDSYGSTLTVFNATNLHSYDFMVAGLIALFGLRIWKNKTIPQPFLKLITWVGVPSVTVIAAALTIFDYYLPINTVYAYTNLHDTHWLLLALFWITTVLIQQSDTWWQRNWRKVLYVLPFASFAYMILVRLLEFNIFLEIVKEDRPIEYLQFFILAFGGMYLVDFGLRLRWTHWKLCPFTYTPIMLSNYAKLFFITCGVVLLLVAGDEISWGQRIIGLETPDAIAEINRQDELTFHNMYAVEWLVIYGYVFISLFGLFAWPLGKTLLHFFGWIRQEVWYQWLKPWLVLLPQPYLFGFFLLSSYFFVQQLRHYGGIFQPWSEPAELVLYAGTVIWLIEVSSKVAHARYKQRTRLT